MTPHTPGPWRVMPNATTDQILTIETDAISGNAAWRIATVKSTNEPVGLANARLIAAAPDMLAVLRDIEMETRKGGQWTPAEINEVARAAIAKAEGGQP